MKIATTTTATVKNVNEKGTKGMKLSWTKRKHISHRLLHKSLHFHCSVEYIKILVEFIVYMSTGRLMTKCFKRKYISFLFYFIFFYFFILTSCEWKKSEHKWNMRKKGERKEKKKSKRWNGRCQSGLWHCLSHCLRHIPKTHLIREIMCGEC